jgi:hypothetical protein
MKEEAPAFSQKNWSPFLSGGVIKKLLRLPFSLLLLFALAEC